MAPVLESSHVPPVRRRRGFLPPARLAGVLLLTIWVGPVTFVQTDGPSWLQWLGAPQNATAFPRSIPPGQAFTLQPGTPLELRLLDGSTIKGRFLGRDLLGDSLYAQRFEACSRDASHAPFALGDTLHVRLRDGREWTLPFAGYGEMALLLRAPDRAEPLRVPFELACDVYGANGERVDPAFLARAFREGRLPSAEALVLDALSSAGSPAECWDMARRVPAEDVRIALADLPAGGGGDAGAIAGGVVLGVVVGVVLVAVLLSQSRNTSTSGCTYNGDVPRLFSEVPLTTRPFDLERGCFEGDVLVADAWPEADGAEPLALAAPSPARSPGKQ